MAKGADAGVALGHFYNADSPIHRLDPRCKLTILLLYIVAVFLLDRLWALGLVTLLTLVAVALSRVPGKVVLRAMAPLLWILIFPLFINLIVVHQGDVLVHWGIILITSGGLRTAVFMTLRLFLLILAATILTLSTSPIALCDGVESMLQPFAKLGMPAHEMAMMTSIALRFIPLLMDEARSIRNAQASRGAPFETGGFLDRARAYVSILVPLFASAFDHAEDLANAMEARCYRGGKGRTRYHELRLGLRDLVAFLLVIALLALGLFA